MKQVFVSYASADKAVAYEIVEYLEGAGISCFIAPRDISGGKAYAKALMEAIDQCDLVLLVASSAILPSEHVLNEVEAVINKKKLLLPILVEDFEMSDEYKYYLGRKQWVRILSAFVGLALCYTVGTLWYMYVYTETAGAAGLWSSLLSCVIPFILPDLGKIALALWFSRRLEKIRTVK